MPASREELEKLLRDHREGRKQQLMDKARKTKIQDERIRQMLQNRKQTETHDETSDNEVHCEALLVINIELKVVKALNILYFVM